jgi:hypothetical protein
VRGFFLGCLVLIGLDVATRAPASRLAELAATPAAWLAAWMDPHTPLITRPVPSSAAASAAGGGSSAVHLSGKPNQLGEQPGTIVIDGKTYQIAEA